MSELKITLRVKHEPNFIEKVLLHDRIEQWCKEFCLEKQELKMSDWMTHVQLMDVKTRE